MDRYPVNNTATVERSSRPRSTFPVILLHYPISAILPTSPEESCR